MTHIAEFLQESNRIEGYDIGLEVYQEALQGKTTSVVVNNSVEGWNYVLQQHQEAMDVTHMLTVHRLLMIGLMPAEDVGAFRTSGVMVGNHVAPAAAVLAYHVEQFVYDFNAGVKDSLELHFQYEHIHPHFDGNGRTGRLLWAWKRLQEGKTVVPILSLFDSLFTGAGFHERRQNYYDALAAYHLGESDE